jgi:hypothetical protein
MLYSTYCIVTRLVNSVKSNVAVEKGIKSVISCILHHFANEQSTTYERIFRVIPAQKIVFQQPLMFALKRLTVGHKEPAHDAGRG